MLLAKGYVQIEHVDYRKICLYAKYEHNLSNIGIDKPL